MRRSHCNMRNGCASHLYVILAVLCAFSLMLTDSHTAHAANTGKICKTEAQLDKYLLEMWSEASLASQTRLIDCLQSYWNYQEQADPDMGEFPRVPSIYMLSALQFNPEGFFAQMDKRWAFYNKWMYGINQFALTWYRDPPCALEPRIEQVKILLQAEKGRLKKYKTYRDFFKKFMPMHCRQID